MAVNPQAPLTRDFHHGSAVDMVNIPTPKGVHKYDITPEGQRFGVRHMYETQVGGFTEDRLLTDGTHIDYYPPHVSAWVARRDLPADDINRIGDVSSSLLLNLAVLTYLPIALEQADKTVNGIRNLLYRDRSDEVIGAVTSAVADETAIDIISGLGSVIDQMQSSRTKVFTEYQRLAIELGELGVVAVDQDSSIGLPVKLMAHQYRQQAEQE